MKVSHTPAATSATFDDPNLVSAAGLVPILALADNAGLHTLADKHLSVPTDKGANAGAKVTSLVAGMIAGADSIDDMALLRHGGMNTVFTGRYAPSTLGSFLRTFTFGHVRQLDAIASRTLTRLSTRTPLIAHDPDQYVYVDVDDTIVEVHGHQKQGSGYGYSGVRGLNAILATVSTSASAPVIVGQRLREGAVGSPRGAARLISDALATTRRLDGLARARALFRADSAYYAHAAVTAAITSGADVSVTARMDAHVKKTIATIPDDAWETIEYTNAIYDEDNHRWISKAEVAEVDFTAFISKKKSQQITGRLVVRRIPELNPKDLYAPTLFDTYRFHPFFTTSNLDTVTADKTHRRHAVIEQVNSDVKNSGLAHLPSGKINANAAWLVLAVIAFNLTRAAATIAGTGMAKATTATIRTKLVSVPARIATSARRVTLHLPEQWPWETEWRSLFAAANAPPVRVVA
ncbi:MAG: IS1380 family transposase [Brevibacterium sp.]|nr:IS1380 family transposase [Brevibacterium sp.]MDN5833139.1 IS1380 family transposase [Brevibacterium sp.]MDN5876927.1 IS1380 family transposase [Brevibacterium sp.]MDN5908685.1 IS1380 family transposase [Brevibacterium sp.]MDN6133616.1 IS1380 family transposase [Brevibacterium sp.]